MNIQPPSAKEIVIIRYNAGNVQSVQYALDRIGVSAVVTDDPTRIRDAERVIFPGVGEASSAMRFLRQTKLDELIKQLTQPVLGICLGMQLLFTHSEENNTDCLGIFEERVYQFRPPEGSKLKVPQIGWNEIHDLKGRLFENIDENSFCYFVHGFAAEPGKNGIALTDYVKRYSSALQKDNYYGVQFHPEKSADVGERILKNFLNL
jgi:glutamine amidotransferase